MKALSGNNLRRLILEESKRANVGHIGSALSVADIVAVLYDRVLNLPSPDHPERDRFVLSKGHAALALYAALYLKGWISHETLQTYCTDGSVLGVHPDHIVNGIDFSTGSLGHGLSFAAGAALAARISGSDRRAYALLSDAECNEGSTWEAIAFAAHHRLTNLIAIVDLNGQQALGYTRDVLDLSPLADKWRAFGWNVIELDGHNESEIEKGIQQVQKASDAPGVLIAHTTFGKGTSFMEGKIKWHYQNMSDEEYEAAISELEDSS